MNKFDFIDYSTLTNDNCGIKLYEGDDDISIGKIVLNGVEITDTESWYEAINTFTRLENEIEEKDKEITRLNNIIDECLDSVCCIEHNLEKYEEVGLDHFEYALNKTRELKDYLIELKEGK